jgi:XTP/dITP diphosphohydrolase
MILFFATTNEGKLKEARDILGVEIEGTPLEIDEIQSLDHVLVAKKKALAYFYELKKPVFIEDVSLSFEALKRLPGTYINDFSKELGNEGLIDLLKNSTNRKALARTTICFIESEDDIQIFEGEVKGEISDEERGSNGFGWDTIFIPEGSTKTFAEMELEEKNNYSMRAKALGKFKEFLQSGKY